MPRRRSRAAVAATPISPSPAGRIRQGSTTRSTKRAPPPADAVGHVRALGLDLGSRRIGVAISDRDGRVATPVDTITRGKSHAADHARIAALVAEWDAEIVAVGLPLSLDGGIGPAARSVLDEVSELARALPVPVETVDERFTT